MSSTFLRGPAVKRSVALIGVGALTIGTLGFLAAPANAAPVRSDLSATCEGLEDSPFQDIAGRTQEAQDAIGCLYNYDITQGRSADEYAPEDTVSRQEMAIFIARQVQYVVANSAVDYTGPAPVSNYSDRDELTTEGQAAVDLLTDLDVVTGNVDGTYDGERAITRAEMAVFIDRVQDVIAAEFGEGARYNPEDADAVFTDIDDSDFFADEVYSLQSVGIVQGTGSQNYSPDAPVIRNDMAFFIMRHLDENIVADRVESLAGNNVGSFAVSPSAAAEVVLQGDETVANANRDADNRTYTVSGLTNGVTYRVTLVDDDSIRTQGGVVQFLASADSASSTGFSADVASQAAADIVAVNNSDITGVKTTTVTPVNGVVTFELDGAAVGDVVPVFYVNGGPDGTATTGGRSARLEVDATQAGQFAAPVESFGLGGELQVVSALGAEGNITSPAVTAVNKAGNSFTTASGRYTYDANDFFQVGGASVGLDEFEAQLSTGDSVSGTFAQSPGGSSAFSLTDDNPALQAGPVGTVSNRNVTLNSTLVGDVDQVIVQRANVSVGGNPDMTDAVGAFTNLATVDATDIDTNVPGVQFRYVDSNVPVGTYRYRLVAINDGDTGPTSAAVDSTNVTVVNPDTVSPTLTDVRVITNGGSALQLDAGDTFRVITSEAVVLAPNATLRVQDADGTVVDIVRGAGGTTFVQGGGDVVVDGVTIASDRVTTVTVGTVTPLVAGTAVGLDLPVTITGAAGISDADENALLTTGDNVIDNES